MTKEPSRESLLAARLARAYPSLSAYSAASLATELCAIERAQRRHAERCCSGEDGGYTRPRRMQSGLPGATVLREHGPEAEERAEQRVDNMISRWLCRLGELNGCNSSDADDPTSDMVSLQGDPRGPCLLLQLPGESEPIAV